MLNGLIARGIGKKEDRHAMYVLLGRASPAKQGSDQQSWEPKLLPHVHDKRHTDTTREMYSVKEEEIGLTF